MLQEKKRTNAWQQPEQNTTDLVGLKRARELKEIKEELPLPKRSKPSSLSQNKWLSDFDPLTDPSPIHLKLDKLSQSFIELLQKRLNQSNEINNGSLPGQNLQVGNKKDVKARVGTSDAIDKLKASNFPAKLLKIGNWEYASQHDGDLVAKCYFAKHKLVWEVLDGALKNKIEIQWEDILGLQANFPENGPGSLTVTVGKSPLFFRETNPLPRKHTIWQATTDFTDGEATKASKHYIQCAQGELNKHYEKLIHCDTRLNFLSQQSDTVLEDPFPEASIKAPNILNNIVSNYRPEMPVVTYDPMVLQPTPLATFSQNDFWRNNINGWQDVNHLNNHDGMISSTSKWILPNAKSAQNDTMEDHVNGWQDGYNYSNLVCNLPSDEYLMKQGWGEEIENEFGQKQDLDMRRDDSFNEFMSQLPTIAPGNWFDDDNMDSFDL